MPRKSCRFRTLAGLVLLCFSLTLLPAGALAEPGSGPGDASGSLAAGQTLEGFMPSADLTTRYTPAAEGDIMVVAHATGASQSKEATEGVKQESCCGDFWDVHFGGYRWAWWALAGAGLIAIHAN